MVNSRRSPSAAPAPAQPEPAPPPPFVEGGEEGRGKRALSASSEKSAQKWSLKAIITISHYSPLFGNSHLSTRRLGRVSSESVDFVCHN